MVITLNREQFETKLNEVYKGAVKPLTAYYNERAVMVYKCNDCGVSFFGKPNHMVGKKHQQHLCNMPYGDKDGTRLDHVGGKNKPRSNKSDNKKLEKQIEELIWNDYSYQQIAKELKVNPDIIKDYFKSEGLID